MLVRDEVAAILGEDIAAILFRQGGTPTFGPGPGLYIVAFGDVRSRCLFFKLPPFHLFLNFAALFMRTYLPLSP